jgi:polyphosphate kinase
MPMKEPRYELRYEVADRETLERIAAEPLPADFAEEAAAVECFRDVYFDTAAGDLNGRGATVRLRLHEDGRGQLSVITTDRRGADGSLHMHTREIEVEAAEPAALFNGVSASANMVRGLVDPARLVAAFELEVLRRVRSVQHTAAAPTDDAGAATAPTAVQLGIDIVTVRAGDLSSDLYELELSGHADAAQQVSELGRELANAHGLRPVLAEMASRARELFEGLERRALRQQVRAARQVAVVVHDRGSIAFVRRSGNLALPTAPGSGSRACRRAMRRVFGHGQARLRLLGVRGDVPGRPALEVWLAEDVASLEKAVRMTWLPIERALRGAGAPRLRDPRTLAALQVVARSSFASWAPPASGTGVLPRRVEGGEPFEVVLQRLEAGDPKFEPPVSDVPPQLLLNMDLSRLSFDERILAIAEDKTVPLLERIRFLGMFGERRDDFFMSRVAHFKRLLARGDDQRSIDGLSPSETLDAIATRARQMMHRAYELLNQRLLPELQRRGIRVENWESLSREDRAFIAQRYGDAIEALVMPVVADPAHPFPHVRNLRPALAAIVRSEAGAEQLVAIELPGELPRFAPLADGRRFVLLEDIIEAQLPLLYPGLELVEAHTFRVTRSAQLDLSGEPLDMLQAVEEEVTRRPFQEVVRLEVEHTMPPSMRHLLLREFQYEMEEQPSTPGEQDVYTVGRLVDLAALEEIAALDVPDLKFPPLEYRSPLDAERSVFEQVREGDRLFHFPYDDFENSVERFLHEAAGDPDVLSIRATLYRTSRDSGVVAALRRARELGKDVGVLVELKASFDEQRNIEWARGLEQDGIRVVFSPVRFKVHAKIALVVRREGEELRRYAYIGTGNLNAATARSYVDLGLLTCDADLAREIGAVFNLLTGYSGGGEISRLLVAPFDMRRRLLSLIERETAHARAGRPARIRVQLNGLADRRLIGALYRASAAGVRIEMMVREICALRPGMPGISENISVVSVVGRLLQHARITHFHNNGDDEYYIGSADWRPRNLAERVEVVAPVLDRAHHAVLDAVLDSTLNDPGAWHLGPDGEYHRTARQAARSA